MYKLTAFGVVLRLSDNAIIPMDMDNKDYREHLEWLDEGNTPLPEDPATEPEIQCSAYQIREALNQLAWRDAVESAIANGDQSLKDAWEYATAFRRDHAKIAQIAQAIGKTDADIDALFNLAVTLVP